MYNQYPFYQQMPQMNNIMQQARQEIAKVNGENGARAYQIAPNSSVLLLDEQEPIVYLKTSDSGGYGTVTAYSITPYKQEAPIDVKSLEKRIEKLEEMMQNGKSNTQRTNQSKPNERENKSNQSD